MRHLTAALVLTAVLAGCGVQPIGNATQLRAAAQAEALKAKAPAHGLGLNLKGMALLKDDSRELEEGVFAAAASLPAKVDLRAGSSPIANQGGTNACVGYALADGIGEYLARKAGRPLNLSPGFIWNQTRHVEKQLDDNAPTNPTDSFKIADNLGFAEESVFPSISAAQKDGTKLFGQLLTIRPSNDVIANAKKNRFIKGFKAITTVHALKKSLASDMPVMLGVAVYESTMKVGASGAWPLPAKGEESLGGHAITCVGYDNVKKHFIIRNSWGTSWGDKGYGYMPYAFVKSESLYMGYTGTN